MTDTPTPKNCGVYHAKHDCFCTRPAGHEGYHVATFGPFGSAKAKEIHRWPPSALDLAYRHTGQVYSATD